MRVRLEGSGVCGSSGPVWEGRPWFEYPLEPGAPGHEGWGVVDAVGADVTSVAVGERVAALSYHAHATHDLADGGAVVGLPPELDGVPFPGEPLGCAMNVFERSDVREGHTVAIVGIGFLGALLTQLAVAAGARVVALSRVRGRLIVAGFHQDGERSVDMQGWNWRGLDVINAHERPYRLEWMDDPWPDVDAAGAWLLELEAAARPDVVHLDGYAHGTLPWRAPLLMVAHSCVASWWRAVKDEEAPPAYDEYRRRVRRGVAAADLIVAPTGAMLRALDRHHGPLGPARVIRNGRDASHFAPARKEPFVLSVGRLWDEAKNSAGLAEAAAELPWPVQVAGDATRSDGGETAVTNGRVLGRLTPREVAHRMARAAIYAHPARYEPFGLSVLEAALSGCALVLGDLESLRETWGDAALYADPDDPDVLRRAVAGLIDDEPKRRALADRAMRRARTLTPEAMAAAYRTSYQNLIGRTVVA